jgi:hypothetical protein
MQKRYFLITILMLSFSFISCKSAVYLNVSEPAAVPIPKEINRVGIINRSYAAGNSKIAETIDKGISLEGNLDQVGSTAAINGTFDQLTTNQRFEYITILDSIAVENRGIGTLPAPMDWQEVMAICDANDLSFLFVLEIYDTDTKISYSSRTVTKSTPLGNVPLLEHTATSTTFIRSAWRMYDPASKQVIDEYFYDDQIAYSGRGINPVVAAAALLNREQAVKNISTNVGRHYATRIQPQVFRVNRTFWTKGSNNLRIARRRADVNDWDGAAEMWKKDMNSNKRKVAGRATHNMAIYYEIQGDVYKALEHAQKAYSDYNNKEARRYARILNNRIRRLENASQIEG